MAAIPQRLERMLAALPIERFRDPPPVVGVLRLAGIIGQIGPLRRGLTLAGLAEPIERAFRFRHLKAVALAVNSPGGSPVQAGLIAGRIRALADEKGVPVLAFAEDVAASGGYWLALAADEIYADRNSIVGSIGVVSAGFGFTELIRRLGIERRVHAVGEHKAMLDPFRRERPDDVARLETIQEDIHAGFRAMVRTRRGERLKGDDAELFSGAFWTGGRALELGLIDGLGDLRTVMRERFGERVRLRPSAARPSPWRRPAGVFAGRESAGSNDWAAAAIAAVEERMLWSRFGI